MHVITQSIYLDRKAMAAREWRGPNFGFSRQKTLDHEGGDVTALSYAEDSFTDAWYYYCIGYKLFGKLNGSHRNGIFYTNMNTHSHTHTCTTTIYLSIYLSIFFFFCVCILITTETELHNTCNGGRIYIVFQ